MCLLLIESPTSRAVASPRNLQCVIFGTTSLVQTTAKLFFYNFLLTQVSTRQGGLLVVFLGLSDIPLDLQSNVQTQNDG